MYAFVTWTRSSYKGPPAWKIFSVGKREAQSSSIRRKIIEIASISSSGDDSRMAHSASVTRDTAFLKVSSVTFSSLPNAFVLLLELYKKGRHHANPRRAEGMPFQNSTRARGALILRLDSERWEHTPLPNSVLSNSRSSSCLGTFHHVPLSLVMPFLVV